jgi:dUTP pyrophosphatase
LTRPDAAVPAFGSAGAAGADLYACTGGDVRIRPGEQAVIPTGVAIALPSEGYVGLVYVRSGLGVKHGLSLSNAVGVIDSDYRGEIQVALRNHSDTPYTVRHGDRVAQLVVTPTPRVTFEVQDELPDTARGRAGFGSTGR